MEASPFTLRILTVGYMVRLFFIFVGFEVGRIEVKCQSVTYAKFKSIKIGLADQKDKEQNLNSEFNSKVKYVDRITEKPH